MNYCARYQKRLSVCSQLFLKWSLELTGRDVINASRARLIQNLQYEIECGEVRLRQQKATYDGLGMICNLCWRKHPSDTKKCHPCHATDLSAAKCTSGSRIAGYFAVLEREGLWPSFKWTKTWSLSAVVYRLTVCAARPDHTCVAGAQCPLKSVLHDVGWKVDQMVKAAAQLCPDCVSEDGREDDERSCVCKVSKGG